LVPSLESFTDKSSTLNVYVLPTLSLVLSYLRSSGIKDFFILSKTDLGEKVMKSKDLIFEKKEKEKIKGEREIEKRLDTLENMLGKLLIKKE
jgi:dTDP-glucose pyrophosphorylase